MTHTRNIRDDVQQAGDPSVAALRIQRLLQAVMNLSQLAESDARREKAQHRERHHAALIAAIVCRILQDRTRIGPSGRQRPPRFSNITETEACHYFRCRAEEDRAETPLPLTTACTTDSMWCFAVDPRSVGKLRFAFSSVAWVRRCSACSTYVQ